MTRDAPDTPIARRARATALAVALLALAFAGPRASARDQGVFFAAGCEEGERLRIAAVGDDLDTPINQLHVNQDTAVMRRIPHAQRGEQCFGTLSRSLPAPQCARMQRAFHGKTQFAIVCFFRCSDSRLDRRQHIFGKRAINDPVRSQ